MEINRIQLGQYNNYTTPNTQTRRTAAVSPVLQLNTINRDSFESTSLGKTPSFTGATLIERLIIHFLKSECYHRSIRGSKRPYTHLEPALAKITKQVQIPVTVNESINAFDINPNNAQKYILFLHGFSHNITSNQPLYKSLSKSDYGILAIDYRGYGKNKPSKHIRERHIEQDTVSALDYLQEKGVSEVGVIGHSFGGYLAAKLSNKHKISFQVLVAPLTSLEFWLRNVLKHPKKYPQEMRLIKYVPKFKDQYAKIFNIKEHLESNTTPTYIVQSKLDRYIRAPKVTALTKIIPNLKKYVLLQSGGHRMDDEKIHTISSIIQHL
ncbi:MAG: alpha/beta fold hydrolase [Muribaculaceae bacterium]|nr:alpha/beta fold hydrolase [Muribaculaceae bacterium]